MVTISPMHNGTLLVNFTTSSFDASSINVFGVVSSMAFIVDRNLVAREFVVAHLDSATVKQSAITSVYNQKLTAVLSYDAILLPATATIYETSIPSSSSSSG